MKIKELTKKILEQYLKCKVHTTRCGSFHNADSIERHYNCRVPKVKGGSFF